MTECLNPVLEMRPVGAPRMSKAPPRFPRLAPITATPAAPPRKSRLRSAFVGASPGLVSRPGQSRYHRWGKRALDIAIVLVALPIVLPLLFAAAVALAFERKGIFFTQKRIGLNGQSFSILKFRTMVPGADSLLEAHLRNDPALQREWDETQKLKQDPRITRLGGFLRRTSMDELPQLWHVLTGEMSIVGPRPMLPKQAEIYGDMRAYVRFRPGITGLWQVMERNDGSFADRALADRRYARTCSLWQDLKLIILTVGVVLRGTGY